ncbi:MAG TPA: GNAT family N-acetyltransferase [Caulobacterales bacterium]|nr:GNAT family N-acetyltransferase [Caulobacterales bacterium]
MRVRIENPSPADIDLIHAFLTESYWSPGIPRETVARAARNSICAIARGENGALIGYARAVSDCATFAWVADVMVLPEHRGRGLGRALVKALQDHPELQNLRRWMLGTRDAHGVYAALGFEAIAAPERYMHILKANPYGKPQG